MKQEQERSLSFYINLISIAFYLRECLAAEEAFVAQVQLFLSKAQCRRMRVLSYW